MGFLKVEISKPNALRVCSPTVLGGVRKLFFPGSAANAVGFLSTQNIFAISLVVEFYETLVKVSLNS